jgi:hypothetical protein
MKYVVSVNCTGLTDAQADIKIKSMKKRLKPLMSAGDSWAFIPVETGDTRVEQLVEPYVNLFPGIDPNPRMITEDE